MSMPECGPEPQLASSGNVALSPPRVVALGHNGRMAGKIRADRLRALRAERREALIEVSAATGVERSHLNKMELGEKQPSLSVLDALAHHYGVSPDYLLGWSDDRLPRQGGQALENEDQRAFLAAYLRLPDEVRSRVERIVQGVPRGPDSQPRRRKGNNAG
jgi:transcriptional regulator with XRE-family HTH domain